MKQIDGFGCVKQTDECGPERDKDRRIVTIILRLLDRNVHYALSFGKLNLDDLEGHNEIYFIYSSIALKLSMGNTYPIIAA